MHKLLITAFEPFGGAELNSSEQVLHKIDPMKLSRFEVEKLILPVVFGEAFKFLQAHLEQTIPDTIVALGQAGGRGKICVERVAINVMSTAIPDNSGFKPLEQAIDSSGPVAYWTGLRMVKMVQACHDCGVPAEISSSAGTFVCNELFYQLMSWAQTKQLQAGFVHIPLLPQQAREGDPSLDLDQAVVGLTAMLQALRSH